MEKPIFFLWPIAWIVFAGVLMTVALLVPAAQGRLGLWLGVAAAVSVVLAYPVAATAAKAFRE